MNDTEVDVLVKGVRCQVLRREAERLLVVPRVGLNVTSWVGTDEAIPLGPDGPIFSPDEIRHLAAVLRQVFYEEATAS